MERPFLRWVCVVTAFVFVSTASADDALRWSGFALLRGSSAVGSGPLAQESLSAQLQLGIDWSHSPTFCAHVHLLARDDEGTRRGSAGIPEAYLELNLHPGKDRLRIRGGAFFLPTSRENVDALWENPYAITSSALNSWLGEELRPIGIDVTWFRQRAFAGATVFRGNDTLGALPPVRGWTLDDHWTLLGEWVPVDAEYFTSVSAENDGRLGWAARAGWNGDHLLVQLTHFDNRSDGLEYGALFNWGTHFTIVSAESTIGDWTLAGESGWGTTFLIAAGEKYPNQLDAGYVLVSRRWARTRATIRVETFRVDDARDYAVTVAAFRTLAKKLRLGAEVATSDGTTRGMIEVRYYFGGR